MCIHIKTLCIDRFRSRFSAKLILLISLVFIIPVATLLMTIHFTSKTSLARFDNALLDPQEKKNGFIKEIFSQTNPDEIGDTQQALLLLRNYEHRRAFGLLMNLTVISCALAGIVILLSMLILKREMLSLNELSKAKEKAEESSRLRSEFLANMSHEIRTPLNGILGLAEVMAEDEDDEEKKSNLESIEQCGRNLLHLINEILELSKLEAKKLILHPAIVPIADVIREASATIVVECKRKDIELKSEIAADVPKAIEVDSHKLVRILVNLLGNALKFTEHGFIHLRVLNFSGERPGNLLFEVKDTGVGVPKERMEHIYEGFIHAEEYMKRGGDGTGLGLAISRKLVTLMGGDIWFESEPGKGSVFSFTIKAG